MGKIIEFLKDKIYYVMGITIFIIVLIIILSSCSGGSGGNTYEQIEKNMVSAAQNYYSNKKDRLPNVDGNTVKVSISTLVELELLKDVVDSKDKTNVCTGFVEVTKVGENYSYIPFLTCPGNYEAKYLKDIIINSGTDELGNGIYNINDEYIYRGEYVNNYVKFNDMLWRIVKVDSEGDIKLVLYEEKTPKYSWDTKYNSEKKGNYGVTTDYLLTTIRRKLNEYYETTFTDDSKAKIVAKDLCIGKYSSSDEFSLEKECSIKKENEKIGLLNLSDYKNACLDESCLSLGDGECTNRNYLSSSNIYTWTLNSSEKNTYRVYFILGTVSVSNANAQRNVNPVIYITSKSIINTGEGTLESPYIVK